MKFAVGVALAFCAVAQTTSAGIVDSLLHGKKVRSFHTRLMLKDRCSIMKNRLHDVTVPIMHNSRQIVLYFILTGGRINEQS